MNGIVVASFGTSFKEAREKSIEPIEMAIASTFDGYEVRRAFTSNMIVKKLKERDRLFIDTPSQAIEKMIKEGFKNIHVQPLHVIPGFEYEKVRKAVVCANHHKDINITLGFPLLSREADYGELITAMFSNIDIEKNDEAYVFMGHGTSHYANACYSMLQVKINDITSNVFIANVEGYPSLDHIQVKLDGYKKVTLMPLMIVAGDHAINDMAGDEEGSYKYMLEEKGKEVTCILKGLGEDKLIHDIFISRVQESIKA